MKTKLKRGCVREDGLVFNVRTNGEDQWVSPEELQVIRDEERKYYLKNKAKIKERTREWQKANPDRYRELTKNWTQNNQDRIEAYKAKAKEGRKLKSEEYWKQFNQAVQERRKAKAARMEVEKELRRKDREAKREEAAKNRAAIKRETREKHSAERREAKLLEQREAKLQGRGYRRKDGKILWKPTGNNPRNWVWVSPETFEGRRRKLQEYWIQREKQKAVSEETRKAQLRRRRQRQKEKYRSNPELKREYNRKQRAQEKRRNPEKYKARKAAQRKAREIKAKVKLTDRERALTTEIYLQAARVSNCLGIPFHVDHILPIMLGGLHHPTNLRAIPGNINLSKSHLITPEVETWLLGRPVSELNLQKAA